MKLPHLYAIADHGFLTRQGIALADFAAGLREGGVTLVQWRCKDCSPAGILSGASVLRTVFAGTTTKLILNDRVDLALLAGFDGVHVGQGDLPVDAVRDVLRQSHSSQKRDEWGTETFVVGVSTHTEAEGIAADKNDADYIAIGPVFATGSKADAAPVVGLEGVRRARALTTKPLVAIGGITRQNCRSVLDAGADSVAVISGLFAHGESIADIARDFLRILR